MISNVLWTSKGLLIQPESCLFDIIKAPVGGHHFAMENLWAVQDADSQLVHSGVF